MATDIDPAKRIFCAVDTPDLETAQSLCTALADVVGGIKLGLEFFCAHGPDGVLKVMPEGMPLFLDLKLHDIPNTVAAAFPDHSRRRRQGDDVRRGG